MTMRRIRLAVLGCISTLALPWTLGCGRTVLSVDDAVIMGGRQTPVTAYLQKPAGLGYRRGVEEIPVEILADGKSVGRTQTQDKGRAEAPCALPNNGCSEIEVRARVGSKTLRTEGQVFNWDADRTIIAVDIDETISTTNYADLLLTPNDDGSRPIRGSREALVALAKDYHIVYVTARPRFLLDRSRNWLNKYGFPAGPLITSQSWEEWRDQTRFKRDALARLRRQWPNLLIGIGDKRVDVDAYSGNGMLTLIVNESDPGQYGGRAVTLRDWPSLARYFTEHRELFGHPARLAARIDSNGRLAPQREGVAGRSPAMEQNRPQVLRTPTSPVPPAQLRPRG